jgi:hypothetical protein
MTTKAERMAADVSYTGDAFVRDTVTSDELLVIPTAWRGKYVTFSAIGADVFVRFGTDNTVACDQTTVSTIDGSGNITFGGAEPHVSIAAGTTQPARIDASQTHMAWIASATGGKFRAALSTGDGD